MEFYKPTKENLKAFISKNVLLGDIEETETEIIITGYKSYCGGKIELIDLLDKIDNSEFNKAVYNVGEYCKEYNTVFNDLHKIEKKCLNFPIPCIMCDQLIQQITLRLIKN